MRDRIRRLKSENASTAGEIVANRVLAGISTVGIGGQIADLITYTWPPPEAIHTQVTALILFGWQTAVFLAAFFWRRYFGDRLNGGE